MAALDEKVYEYLRSIPKGRVVTYGQLAEAVATRRHARAVGNILHRNPDPDGTPCFRVVDSKGRLAAHFGTPGGIEDQKRRLERDGIKVRADYTVDLAVYAWKGI